MTLSKAAAELPSQAPAMVEGSPIGPVVALRRIDVDLARIVAIVAVVGIHVTGTFISAGARQADARDGALVLNALARSGAPLFFAISGWALLARRTRGDQSQWLLSRLARLLVPLTLWTVIYVGHSVLFPSISEGAPPWGGGQPAAWVQSQLSLAVLGPGVRYHLWFMYYLVAISIVIWLIQVRSPRAQAVVAATIVAAIGLAQIMRLPLAWTGFPWALGYAVLGYALFEMAAPPRVVSIALYLGASAAIFVLGNIVGFGGWPYTNPGPTVLAATVAVIWIIRTLSLSPRARPIVSGAALIFGVYFVHPLVMDYVYWYAFYPHGAFTWLPGAVRVVVLLVATLTISFGLAWLWHRSRFLGWLLG